MTNKKAFTLIELLVVIAIIAILAAILFPVFAQAKEAAKKTARISDSKQVALGAIMYSGDYDDQIVIHAWTTENTDDFPDDLRFWPMLVQPYIKNWELMHDSNDGVDPFGIWSGTTSPSQWYYNWMRWPSFGLNSEYLNNVGPDCEPWQPEGFGFPISQTAVAAPANTVYFASTKKVGNDNVGYYPSTTVLAPASILADDTCTFSNAGWGEGSYGDDTTINGEPTTWPGNPTYTGTYAAVYNDSGMVMFVDGHVESMKPGALAAGTNWEEGIANDAVEILDRSAYIWDTQD
ncbi:MAG: prepilin-type N-terminal cleavage/methylation domain-containing protein [Fimbriimonadaceae bacterium]